MKQSVNKKRLGVFAVLVAALAILVATFTSDIRNNMTLGLDLQGGFEILYEISPLEEGAELPDMSAVVKSISKRINVLGVNEPQITIEGDNRVRVQLAGVKDQEQARRLISSTANLTFRDINDNLLADASIIKEGQASLSYQEGRPVVLLQISDANKFAEITKQVSSMAKGSNIMVVWLDYSDEDAYSVEAVKANQGQEPKYISAASVNEVINSDSCIISGNFTEEEARELADLINSGSLPVKMTELSSNVVSADFGLGAFSKTMLAGAVGVLVVMAFMIFVYRLPGIISCIMLVFYIFAIFALYSSIGAVFTLSGIAALVLGVGMTVDANIITYERIKDELYAGRSVQTAVAEGQKMSFSSIFDAQFTTFIAAVIMYVFGTGTVKGFATMLMITTLATMIITVYVSRLLLNLIVKSGAVDNKKSWFGVKENQLPDLAKGENQKYFGPFHNIDYVKNAKRYIPVSLIIIVIAVVMTVLNGFSLNLGIDFSSGTKFTIDSNETISVENVETTFEQLGYDNVRYQVSGDNTVYATMKLALDTEQLEEVKTTLADNYGYTATDNVVSPVVGKDLVRDAIMLTLLAWVAMLLYVTIRFKWDYAVSCIVALVHDVAIVLACFAIFRFEVNIELISCLLAIIGYSINNSIVVFDRVREVLQETPNKKNTPEFYRSIVNAALDNTMLRSVFSSLTTILPVLALLALGSDAIFTFNFAMLVGLLGGTFSSIFIAPTVWFYLRTHIKPKEKKKKKAKREELDEYTIPGINA